MHVQKSIEVKAPPERIWPYFTEPQKVLQWCITFKAFQYTGDQCEGIGTPIFIDEQAGGQRSKMHFEVIGWKKDREIALKMVSGASYPSYEQKWMIEPTPFGSRVQFMETIILPYGVLGKLLGLAGERMSAATVERMLARLKALAES